MFHPALILCLAINVSEAAELPDMDLVRAIKASHEANRALMSVRGIIRFRFSRGNAPDFDAARSGNWTRRAIAQGLYAYDGNRRRYDSVFDFEKAVSDRIVESNSAYSSYYSSTRHLTDGTLSLRDLMTIGFKNPGTDYQHAVVIDEGTNAFYTDYFLPLDVGRPSETKLTTSIDGASKPGADYKIEKASIRADGRSADLVFRGANWTSSSVVDLERGAIPTLDVGEFDKGVNATRILQDDIRRVAGGAWLPHRLLFYHADTSTVEVLIDEARFDVPPSRDLLRLEFSEPISAINRANKLSYPRQKVWDLANLPRLNNPGVIPFSAATREDSPQMPGERPPSRYWPAILIGLGLVSFVLFWGALKMRRNYATS